MPQRQCLILYLWENIVELSHSYFHSCLVAAGNRDSFDFSAIPSLNKQKILELARGEWITNHSNVCLLGQPRTGKTHIAISLAAAACRQGHTVRFFTAAALVNLLEEKQKAYLLD